MSDNAATGLLTPIVDIGRNVWRIERARHAAVVIDAAAYFHLLRGAMQAAREQILLIGWDFDTRIPLEPGPDGRGESLAAFMLRLAHARPQRAIRILKWNFGALKLMLSPAALIALMRWRITRAITYRFDKAHPTGCSHHQKLVVIDDSLAVCGGIDTAADRWDTPDHADDEPRRRRPRGGTYPPWHDITMLVDGNAAEALAELGRERWQIATGEAIDAVSDRHDQWPTDVMPQFSDVDIAIARTRAEWDGHPAIREVEALWLEMIAAARRFIYIENQYLTSGKIAAAIARRMAEDDPIEVIVVMPRTADGWLEQMAMDGARAKLARAIGIVDRTDRFRVYVPVTAGGTDIYVHAKLAIVDDRLLRVGSANLNNRSLGLDSECDIVIDCALAANAGAEPAIRALRYQLLAEHLGASVEDVERALTATGSMAGAITALNGEGKRLDLLELVKPGSVEAFIAENELLDPTSPDGFFEPLHKRGLWKSWRKGLKWRPKRWNDWRNARRAARVGDQATR